jgi:hypothetical protein
MSKKNKRCHMTHKFSQCHFQIQTRSQRRREGPRPRRLTETLQPSCRCSMGAYQSHRAPDGAQVEGSTLHRPDMITYRSRTGQDHDQ